MATMYIRAPDHLGDGVMALPAIDALKAQGPVQIDGPPWAVELYGERCLEPPRAEVAVLFKPSFSAAWRARRCRRRIGLSWDLRGALLTDPIAPGKGHRTDEYAAIARVAGAEVTQPPCFTASASICVDLPASAVLLLPLTHSTATVAWAGFRELADALDGRAVFAGGPGEDDALHTVAGPHPVLPTLSLAQLAEVARAARTVVGNDSGLTHFAAAAIRGAGKDPSQVHVIYGSTDPSRTGPPGTQAHRLAPLPCWPCYRKRCAVTPKAPCLEVSVSSVLLALETG